MITLAKLMKIKEKTLNEVGDKFNKNVELNSLEIRDKLRNAGVINPLSIEEYIARDGYLGALKASQMKQTDIIQEMKKSGLRGRGGAGFPTGLKWQFAHDANADQKYIIMNADEGIPGDYMDRIIMESDPHSVIEGMLIAGMAIGATKGFIYLRIEYPKCKVVLEKAIKDAYELGILGSPLFNTDFKFDIELRIGAGAYICGEETALIESIEGMKGQPRNKPPFPVTEGLYGKPTVVNNVETLCIVPQIIQKGGHWYHKIGNPETPGTKIHTISGKVRKPGYYELPTGMPIKTILEQVAGGMANGSDFKAVLFSGPSGGFLKKDELFRRTGFDTLAKNGVQMGAGGLIVLDESNDIVSLCRSFMKFNMKESCGRCTPCREGTVRIYELLKKIESGMGTDKDLVQLEDLSYYMINSAFCGLGQSAPNPVLSGLDKFRNEFQNKLYNFGEGK
ncbi:NADH-quinone oxidoreductase subunit NuoF [Mycoplasmatota bacterium zrk1]